MNVQSINYPAILAGLVGGEASDWESFDGPESGVGVDYWYRRESDGAQAYIVKDQEFLEISSELIEGEFRVDLDDLPEDLEWIADHVQNEDYTP